MRTAASEAVRGPPVAMGKAARAPPPARHPSEAAPARPPPRRGCSYTMPSPVAAGAAEAARAEKVEGGIGASVRSRSGADVQRTRSWSLGGSGSLGVFIDRILIQRLLFMQRHPKIGNNRTASCRPIFRAVPGPALRAEVAAQARAQHGLG